MANKLVPVILCGGSGVRLWPLSRGDRPKQFLRLFGERSLFQEAVLRTQLLPAVCSPLIVGNRSHRMLLQEELTELHVRGAELLLEPMGRNTAPALAVAALHAGRVDPKTLLLAIPSDHHVEDGGRFAAAVQRGMDAAMQGAIVVFGVIPDQAHTGYGYIRRGKKSRRDGVWPVMQFVEKPAAELAAAYVASGEYLWNSGMFLSRVDVYLEELRRHAPDIAAGAEDALARAEQDGGCLYLDERAFTACPADSIDYAVMEHTDAACVVQLDTGWSDLGSWPSLLKAGANGSGSNAVQGDVLLADVHGSFVHSSSRLVAAVGLRDQVVIETPDAVLVAPLDRAKEVRQLVNALESAGRPETLRNPREQQPWGWREALVQQEGVEVWRIELRSHADLPVSWEPHRSVHWSVVRGEAELNLEHKVIALHEGDSTCVPANGQYRLRNVRETPLMLIEVLSRNCAVPGLADA